MGLHTTHPTPPTTQTQLPSQGASDQPLMLLKQQQQKKTKKQQQHHHHQQQKQPNKISSKQLAVTVVQ